MKISKFIASVICITFLLLSSVVATDVASSVLFDDTTTARSAVVSYPVKDMLFGVLIETLRAVFICHLYVRTKKFPASYSGSIKFGLLISGVIATMWLVIGYGSFQLKNPERFVVYDGIILLLQGVVSGVGLKCLYNKKLLTD